MSDDLPLANNTHVKTDLSQRLIQQKVEYKEDEKRQVPVNLFTKDTIASAEVGTDKPGRVSAAKESLSNAVTWLWGLIYGKSSNSDQPNGRPILEVPSIQDEKARKNFVKEITDMQKRMTELDEEYKEFLKSDPHNNEALLMKILTLAIKKQLQLKEEDGLLSTKKVHTHQKTVQGLNKDQMQIKDELSELDYRNQWAGTLDNVVLGGSAVVALGTLLLAGGAAISAPFIPGLTAAAVLHTVFAGSAASAGKVLAVAKTGTSALTNYTQHAADQKSKKSYEVENTVETESDRIKIETKNIGKAFKDVSEMWSLLRESAERQREASRGMIGRG
jgi:hypothetical protein